MLNITANVSYNNSKNLYLIGYHLITYINYFDRDRYIEKEIETRRDEPYRLWLKKS